MEDCDCNSSEVIRLIKRRQIIGISSEYENSYCDQSLIDFKRGKMIK